MFAVKNRFRQVVGYTMYLIYECVFDNEKSLVMSHNVLHICFLSDVRRTLEYFR